MPIFTSLQMVAAAEWLPGAGQFNSTGDKTPYEGLDIIATPGEMVKPASKGFQ